MTVHPALTPGHGLKRIKLFLVNSLLFPLDPPSGLMESLVCVKTCKVKCGKARKVLCGLTFNAYSWRISLTFDSGLSLQFSILIYDSLLMLIAFFACKILIDFKGAVAVFPSFTRFVHE